MRADVDALCAIDHGIESWIEHDLHRFARGVTEVHAVRKLASQRQAGACERRDHVGPRNGRAHGEVGVQCCARHTGSNAHRHPPDQSMRGPDAVERP